jgi:arabinan endo-1,5-alpha-L-arabinosidase
VDLLPKETGGTAASDGGTGSGGTFTAGGRSGSKSSFTGGTSNAGGAKASTSSTNGLPVELIHRYDFEGTGTEIFDRAGGQSGVVLGGATLNGTGALTINDGVSYVRLPSWLIKNAKTPSLTIASWITWQGGASWQRVFDFGATNEGNDQPGTALAQFYFTPKFEPVQFYSTLLDGDANTAGQATVEGTYAFPTNVRTLVVVVVEGDSTLGTSTVHLYVDGAATGTASTVNQRLTEFTDQNCWLAQSQWIQDADPVQHFNGSYDEFRIYSRALSATEISHLSLTDPTKL